MFPNFDIEQQFEGSVCGIDEVGRGPLAGPVVASAVIIRPHQRNHPIFKTINDSKKVSAKKRAVIAEALPELAYVGLGSATIEEIDRVNIFQATFIAMQRAYEDLIASCPDKPVMCLIDGKFSPKLPCDSLPIIKGDQKSLSIAAASIIAKEHRDTLMKHLAIEHPHYGWERNAGYGTKQHIEALKSHGITIHHRKSFKPISEVNSTTY